MPWVNPENADLYRWYDFVREYHQRDNPHCPELSPIHGRPVTAVLDGQQRLTAFNIGLRGSMARKIPYRRWNSWDAFPRNILALDLLAESDHDEEGNRYTFKFIDEGQVGLNGNNLCFKVGDILGMESGPSMSDWIHDHGLDREQHSQAYRTLDRLHRAIRVDNSVAYYEELSQNIERVLSIFIRCNRGGTPLSYSNLLLSIAVSQWETLDARREVHGLVDEMNRIREGLLFNADFVLKAGLMLTDIASVGFRVENFTRENMATLEEKWPNIRHALLETVELVDSFGFDSRTLQATNSLLPIAYYLYRRGAPRDFEVSDRYIGDRRVIRGSGLDTLLTELRNVLRNNGENKFPAENLGRVMAQRGKTLDFGNEEIEDDWIEEFIGKSERIANLQLLDRTVNNEKRATLPAEWLDIHCPTEQTRLNYCERHQLGDVPREIIGFRDFYEARRESLRERISRLINAT